MKKLLFPLFSFFAIGVGLYPVLYFTLDMSGGLLATKTTELLQSQIWNIAFYTHIACGGISLLTGWSQFSENWRRKYLQLHRNLGKIYVIAVLFGGISGFYIALFATGGMVSVLGFASLAVLWLFTTYRAYTTIQKKQVAVHREWMIRSYALAFAAVTLRHWLPIFQIGLGIGFSIAYPIIAWLCWVPNLVFAEWWMRRSKRISLIS